MKKSILISLAFIFTATAGFTDESEQVERIYPKEINVIHSFSRGIINVFTLWLEVPRNIVLDVNKYPFFGIVSGSMKGLYFSGARLCLSAADICMFGFTGPGAYNPDIFPEYVWESDWNPYATNVPPEMIEMEKEAEAREAQTENMETPY